MKEVYIIRHAESISNIGHRTENHHSIPLSEKGKLQAKELADTVTIIPDLIVISSFSRTHETAIPFIEKHSKVPLETWDVHEFTYMDPSKYSGTTAAERFGDAYKYWMHASVHDKGGPEAESFAELTKRMEKFIEKVKARPEKTIVIFSHGRFILGLKLYIEKIKKLGRKDLSDVELEDLKKSHTNLMVPTVLATAKFPIDNVSIHKLEI